jgi:hypothetical protein
MIYQKGPSPLYYNLLQNLHNKRLENHNQLYLEALPVNYQEFSLRKTVVDFW